MARALVKAGPTDLKRLEEERHQAEAALAKLVEARTALVLAGQPEEIVENDKRQIRELAVIEQCEARLQKLQEQLRTAEEEAAVVESQRAYDAAVTLREDGVAALAEINRHLAAAAAARVRLIKAKAAVAGANRSLPEGCPRILDPEGEKIERGWASILDTTRFPAELKQ